MIRYFSLVAAAALALATPARAAEIKALSTNALKTVLEEL
jgi:mannose/cellobiose epimerase-like protein (N-acyl-D-glucosamine 2-epimerase family)